MTYLQFHFVWLLPAILVAGLLARGAAKPFGRRSTLALVATPILALIYTTPWDNYLVYREVWGYPVGRVLARIGYVPIEEYMFFILQPILTGLLTIAWAGRWMKRYRPLEVGVLPEAAPRSIHWTVVGSGLAIIAAGAWALSTPPGLYFGLILVWAVPVLLGMWLYRGDDIWMLRGPVLGTIAASTLYLCVADRFAIGSGIWWISEEWSTGLMVAGLPVEEATFFLVTNTLVGFGMVLFLDPFGRAAAARRQPD